jgi:hypothetical protein
MFSGGDCPLVWVEAEMLFLLPAKPELCPGGRRAPFSTWMSSVLVHTLLIWQAVERLLWSLTDPKLAIYKGKNQFVLPVKLR